MLLLSRLQVFTNPSFDGHADVDARVRAQTKGSSRSPDDADELFGNRSTYTESGGKHKRVAELIGPASGGSSSMRSLDRHHSHQVRMLDREDDSTGSESNAPSRSSSLLNASLNLFRKTSQPAAA